MVERVKKSPKKIISEVYAQDRKEVISKLFSIFIFIPHRGSMLGGSILYLKMNQNLF